MRDSSQLPFQTPQRDPNRRLKSTPDVKSNPKKVVRKILVPDLTNLPEESLVEVSDHHLRTDSDENSIASGDPVIGPSPETLIMLDQASPSSTVTSEKNVILDDASEVDSSKIESIEVEMVMKCLKEARIRVLKSEDLGYSRKLLNALIAAVFEEYCGGVSGEKKWLENLPLSLSKPNLVLLACMLVILVIFMVWSLNVGAGGILTELPPT